MTKFILIRHGKPDYNFVEEKGFKGHGCDLAFLSDEGIKQAKRLSKDKLLDGADILLSSPYTRCIQTASIISNQINIPIIGEVNLHEWLPDLTYNYNTSDLVKINYVRAVNDYLNGEITSSDYESIYSVQIRALKVLKKYLLYNKVLVVTHGGVMFSLTDKNYGHCGIAEIEFDGKKLIK